MTSSAKPIGNAPSPIAALALKLVGGITILAALVDFLVLLFPPDLLNRTWQITTATQLVDRGIVPLVGIALLFTGFWIDSFVSGKRSGGNIMLDARFWTCLLACILGFIFVVLTPVHINNVRLQSKDALTQVSTEATEAATQLEQRLTAEVDQQRNQITSLLNNPEQFEQLVANGNVTAEQAAQIRRFEGNPSSLDEFLAGQASELRTRLETEIGSRREEATRRVRTEATKASIRIPLSSILLAIGYLVIGFSGMKRLFVI
ncbi:hormogonium polysaccharide biosynthesis protein HpsJ [Leptothoe sp. PORK10 BA2]|uniref:hormogonium polysaccharide biosynthesis protein HpsJ n=1 Tax=Leptothoe sp. PORK10 BA2 TaxID=3110254 RepID=UPI002B2044C1|nr:HpsJ family protein [Leptothoe sp. PORK10 BA2]MEA5462891.1 HpsJ family protein [Leptothoe sp. PORK10 BA2]